MLKILSVALVAVVPLASALAQDVRPAAAVRPPVRHHDCLWSQKATRPLRPEEPEPVAPSAAYVGCGALAIGGLGLLARLRRR